MAAACGNGRLRQRPDGTEGARLLFRVLRLTTEVIYVLASGYHSRAVREIFTAPVPGR